MQLTGMPPIIMQHIMPGLHIAVMQSQQACIIFTHSASPDVHIILQPISVISQEHMPIVMLQQQTQAPLHIMQQLIICPAIIMHRFCSMAAEVLSSQAQVQHIPLAIFSKVIVHLGTMAIDPIPIVLPVIPVIMPGIIPGMDMGMFIMGIEDIPGIMPGVIMLLIRFVWVVVVI
jgi:hypothetical protein